MITGPHTWPELDTWHLWMSTSRAPGTVRIRAYYATMFASLHPDPWAVTTDDVVDFLARPAWGAESRRSARASIALFYRWARITGRTVSDPTFAVPAIASPRALPRPTPEAVLRAALEDADGSSRLMLLLAAYAGLRRAEIARVHADDIDDGTLRVHGKGGRERLIPIHDRLLGPLAGVDGWAFPSRRCPGLPLSADAVGRRMARLLDGAWTAHTLRHRFASCAYGATSDFRAVQELLGHSKPETTMRYTLVPVDKLRATVAAVA